MSREPATGSREVEALIDSTLVDPRVDVSTRETIRRVLSRNELSSAAFTEFCAQAMVLARAASRDTKMRHTMEWLGHLAGLVTGAREPRPLVANAAPAATPNAAPAHASGSATNAISKAFFSPGDGPLDAIVSEFQRARRSADVCVFTITDDRISDAMAAAFRRGVALRVISDNDKAYDEGSDVARLKSIGVHVKIDETEAHMHHKFAVFDAERVLTGSYNWTRSASRYNAENLVISDDSRLREAFTGQFERLWSQLPDMR